ncbi:MAG: calcium/sodium antiporter [Alphaproteobacteria bacterium]|nr:calcium/sodium antiporter [Alphaproteobacteria bacterium]
MLIGGLIVLVLGGDLLVRGASGIAGRLGVSPLLIGLTLVGFGTSTPELVTSLQAAFANSPGIAIGNVVGSNIANILLILGVAALLHPIVVDKVAFRRDGAVLAAVSLMCLAVVLVGRLHPAAGAAFVAALAGYILFCIRQERSHQAAATPPAVEVAEAAVPDADLTEGGGAFSSSMAASAGFMIVGLALTVLGAKWLVASAIELASNLGVSEAVIGLTVVAVGTSLPELVTSVAAALRRQNDIAFGNIVGSNIYNVLFILGVTALVRPIEVAPSIATFDIWVMLGATAALLAMAATNWRVSRAEGGVLLAGYIAYTAWLGLPIIAGGAA